jgi:hypothetical protein
MEEIERMTIEHKNRMEEIEAITSLLNNTQRLNVAEEEDVNSKPNARLGLSTKTSSSANNQKLPQYLKEKPIKKAGFFKRLFKKNHNPETFNPVSGISSEKVRIEEIVSNNSTFSIPEISEDKLILDFPNIDVKKCPLCKSKTMKSKVKKDKESEKMFQFIKCSNVECNFQRKIEVSSI